MVLYLQRVVRLKFAPNNETSFFFIVSEIVVLKFTKTCVFVMCIEKKGARLFIKWLHNNDIFMNCEEISEIFY
jgi:hypothetical protein